MHEMSLTQGIMEILQEQAEAQAFSRVTRVRLEIGALSHIEPDAIAFCFDVVSRGTLADGAALEIERPPGRAHCIGCGGAVTVADRAGDCPECGGGPLIVTGGEDMRIKDLEVV